MKFERVEEEFLGKVELCWKKEHQSDILVDGGHFAMTFSKNKLEEIARAVKKFKRCRHLSGRKAIVG